MTCEDCGFEYAAGACCPRCGYDPAVDLVQCVQADGTPVTSRLEEEISALAQKVESGELDRSKLQEQWKAYEKMAREGNADARHLFGRAALMRGEFDQAHKILAGLADAGHALAQLDLAKIYEEGLGIDKDPFDAIKLYRLAAVQGHPIALFKLAEQHGGGGHLKTDALLANAVMEALVARHPKMFQRKPRCQNGGCGCGNGLSNKEFAVQSAFQMSKMIKYLVLAGLLAFVAYVIWTELNP